jgi:3-methyladenine DNA glycosylase/8-oxoguanine DNA glycosylase
MTARTVLALRGPGGEPVDIRRTVDSHGFSELAPARLDRDTHVLTTTVRLPTGKPRRIQLIPGEGPGTLEIAVLGPAPSSAAMAASVHAAEHILRMDHDLSSFYAQLADDPELAWAANGAGRMLRSQTVFEDVVKTVCTTNCSWALTVKMVNALVSELGDAALGRGISADPLANAFPTPQAMASRPESFYRDTVRAGYRAPYFHRIAELVAGGDIDLEALADASMPDEEVDERLRTLPGVGPYAAAHIMMTLGRNSRLILDSWTRPTYARLANKRRIPADAAIVKRFSRYGAHAGLAFWLYVTRDWITEPDPG